MSDFEFLSVLVSIVIGLGLTHLLGGLGHAFYFRHVHKLDVAHLGWTVAVFFVLVLNWWVLLLWRDFDAWTFSAFLTVILWTTSMYAMALALYPPGRARGVDYRTLFETNRTWFLATFTIMCLFDLLVTYMREQALPDPGYIVFVGHLAVISVTGIAARKRIYDLAAGWYVATAMIVWSFGVRETLF